MAKTIKTRAAKYLPKMICQMLIGFVFKISMVPTLYSSANMRMVMAGIRKMKIHGAKKKKPFKSANPVFRILKSPSKTQRNKPFKTKNTAITKYPIGVEKNEFSSFFNMAIIL